MNRLESAINVGVSAGDLLMDHYGKIYETRNKESLRDVVSEIDRLAEIRVISRLQKFDPDCSILTEENGMIGQGSDRLWIVDALDGTVNYIHNLPFFCVSISYWIDGEPRIGVIYNPYSGELYYAERGTGSFVNQEKLSLEDAELESSITAMAFSGKAYNPAKRSREFEIFGRLNDISQGCLRTGSAAMNLGYLSHGKFSLALGKANKLWDVAAGLLIAEEAGATIKYSVTNNQGYLIDYIAATPSSLQSASSEMDLSYLDLQSERVNGIVI